jgi:hypothetical protein
MISQSPAMRAWLSYEVRIGAQRRDTHRKADFRGQSWPLIAAEAVYPVSRDRIDSTLHSRSFGIGPSFRSGRQRRPLLIGGASSPTSFERT